MNTTGRFSLFLALLALFGGALPLLAQTDAVGNLAGRVTDSTTRLALSGARVSVDGTSLATYTDQGGAFVLTNVPAGPHTVAVSYVGYQDFQRTTIVTAGQTANLEVAVGGDVVTMEKFVIEGSVVGTARAINQQRSAETLTNVVASDAIGQFPDQNAAESLQRVPGLALYRDQGEGRFVIIRGINSQYNAVSINGFRASTSEKGTRSVPLDTIGSDSIASLEVSKVVTPDKDADGLGGSVDIRTRTAFDLAGPQAAFNAGTLYSSQEGRQGYRAGGLYGQTFLDGRLGVLVSGSAQRRPFSSFEFEEAGGWSQLTSPSDGQQHWLFNSVDMRHYEPTRTRNSTTASIDFKPEPGTLIYLRGVFSDFDDREHRWATTVPFSAGTLTALTDTTASVTGVKGVQKRDRERDEDRHLGSGVLGFEKTVDAWRFDGGLVHSAGSETRDAAELRYDTTTNANFSYAFPDPYHIVITQTGGADINDPANYKYSTKSNWAHQIGSESENGVRANARYDFKSGDMDAYIKFGGQYRAKQKDQNADKYVITSVPFALSSAILNDTVYPFLPGMRLLSGPVDSFFGGTPGYPTTLAPSDKYLSDFTAKEDIAAGYAMGSVTVDKLNVIAGLRVEDTDFKTNGFQVANATAVAPVSAAKHYTDWLPGVYLRQDVGKHLTLRASWSNTISRAPYEDTVISRTVDDTKLQVTQGNPKLNPLTSTNWDASAEYYLPSLGLVSAGVFYKQVKNFAYQTVAGTDATTGYPLTTFVNGPNGHISGVELTWQQQLRFLPAPFDGFGLLANATFTDSEAEYGSRPGEKLPFIGQSKTIGNFGLTYEKHGFFARIAANYRTPRLREDVALGTDPTTDRYVDRFLEWDLTASYRFYRGWEIYGEVVDMNNEPFRVYFGGGGPRRVVQREEYGWSGNFGLRWHL
ncbi:MAG TPA: TonB-dependent receptor [Opitutaceae bacterium]|nr:TonB-dependent receptor [Opitutaceae bacterium]